MPKFDVAFCVSGHLWYHIDDADNEDDAIQKARDLFVKDDDFYLDDPQEWKEAHMVEEVE